VSAVHTFPDVVNGLRANPRSCSMHFHGSPSLAAIGRLNEAVKINGGQTPVLPPPRLVRPAELRTGRRAWSADLGT